MSSMRRRASLWSAASLATIMVASGLVACGDDDDGSGTPSAVVIEATGPEGKLSYDAPAEIGAGAAEIEFTNSSELDELDAQLAYVAEERSDAEVAAEVRKAFEGEAVAEWFEGGGGVASTRKGETKSVTQELRPGSYYVVGGEDVPKPPLTRIEVSGDDGAERPEADATVTAEDYSYSGEGLEAGDSTLLVENDGEQWHHFLAARIKEDATIEDARSFLEEEGDEGGPPPFEGNLDVPPVATTVLEGGTSQLLDVKLEAGRYAFFCFVSDKQGGPPHVALGMVSEVTVEE